MVFRELSSEIDWFDTYASGGELIEVCVGRRVRTAIGIGQRLVAACQFGGELSRERVTGVIDQPEMARGGWFRPGHQ